MSGNTQKELKQIVDNHIVKNKDSTSKVVGDNVLMWDTSRLTDLMTGEVETDPFIHHLICTYKSIVIETGVMFNQPVVVDDRQYNKNLDIVLWNAVIGKKYRTSSDFVKLL